MAWKNQKSIQQSTIKQQNTYYQTNSYHPLVNIRDVNMDLQNIKVRGLVISKKPMKLIKMNYENSFSNSYSSFKAVFNFTLRDSVTDCINITSWGKSEHSRKLFSSIHIGDVLLISNPVIAKKSNKFEDYEVQTSSNYSLTINDKQSNVEPYYGGDRNNLVALQNTLLHSMSDHVTLLNMIRYVESSPKQDQVKGQHFTFLVMVREIGTPQDLLSKTQKDEHNQSKILHKMDVILSDESCKMFPVTIWDQDWIDFARIHWIPGVTVLSLVDCRVKYDEYKKGIIGVVDGRTICILNPDIIESHQLRHMVNIQKALNADMNTTDPRDFMGILSIDQRIDTVEPDIPLSSIQNVVSVKTLISRSTDTEYGIIYGVLSGFNIDCDNPLNHFVWLKCSNCKRRIQADQLYCTTLDCPMIGKNVCWTNRAAVEMEFSMVIHITDHTGTLKKCSLSGKVMEEFLRIDPYQLMDIDCGTRSQMKWNLFLNRYKFYIKNSLPSFDNSNPFTKVLGIQIPTVYEVLASVKE